MPRKNEGQIPTFDTHTLSYARPLPALRAKHPDQTALLDAAVAQALHNHQPGETTDAQTLRWLPLVSRRATDWVVLLDPAKNRGQIPIKFWAARKRNVALVAGAGCHNLAS